MKIEAEVVDTIVAIGEAEIDVAPAELRHLKMLRESVDGIVGLQDRSVIDRATTVALDDATLQPCLVCTRKDGHIVECHFSVAHVGEEQGARCKIEQCFQDTICVFQVKLQHMV